MKDQVTIRIWDGCRVVHVMSVNRGGGSTTVGAVGGAHNSTPVDIEYDPWADIMTDNRIQPNTPMSTNPRDRDDDYPGDD